ncbi:membrane protease subunit, stomatin/prohibitin [Leptolyngbya valderiana BDU 20041]|uniref:SPFH domain-containing protein n=1 Tax=Baaleninema simplex TaxID=2862350 RepID=UPI00034C503D|nr:paraslipin [Baaleninema simplex]MDC0831774.1 paraslipin [Geitlerinema sp. CS-897]OAB61165.1 membrane protease subunit, stomatin/prohibitin [Leptolyngbya valderiana BDU 20041]PPT06983.1 Putative stomatin/prohibitin-family membrane protease subunit YbbK [Geitlerinema sp. FC II]
MYSFLAAIVLGFVGYTVGGVKIINQGNQALVERLGKYHRTLNAGLNLTAPFFDRIVWEDTTREQFIQIEPQRAITKDNVSLEVQAVVYWRILDLERAYYEIEDVAAAIQNRVSTILGSEIGQRELDRTVTSRGEINQVMLEKMDEETGNWGVKVTRVDVQKINPSKTVLESMEIERAAEIKKRASILEAEGTAEYMNQIAKALESKRNAREILHFFITQRYVDSSFKLSQSENSKVVFMDPKALSEALEPVLGDRLSENTSSNGSEPEN